MKREDDVDCISTNFKWRYDRIELYNKIYFVCDIVFYMSGILPQKSAKSPPTEFSDSGRDRSA